MDEHLKRTAIEEARNQGFAQGMSGRPQSLAPDLGLALLDQDYTYIYLDAYLDAYRLGVQERERIEALQEVNLRAEREANEQDPQARDRDV